MQLGGCVASWVVHDGTQVPSHEVTHSTAAVAVHSVSQVVLSRAAQTISPATGSHFTVQVSAGST
jgi:hypothetical protein